MKHRRMCPNCFCYDVHYRETNGAVRGRCLDCGYDAPSHVFETQPTAGYLQCVVCGRDVDAREMSTTEPRRFYTFPESMPDVDAAACVTYNRPVEPAPVAVNALSYCSATAVRFYACRERVVCAACAKHIQRDIETPRRYTCNVCGRDALPRDSFRDGNGHGHVCRACFRQTYTLMLRARVKRAARFLNGYEPNAATLPTFTD